jgi:hypothetical protein
MTVTAAERKSMIPKKPAPGLTRGGNRFSEKDHAQTKSSTMIADSI